MQNTLINKLKQKTPYINRNIPHSDNNGYFINKSDNIPDFIHVFKTGCDLKAPENSITGHTTLANLHSYKILITQYNKSFSKTENTLIDSVKSQALSKINNCLKILREGISAPDVKCFKLYLEKIEVTLALKKQIYLDNCYHINTLLDCSLYYAQKVERFKTEPGNATKLALEYKRYTPNFKAPWENKNQDLGILPPKNLLNMDLAHMNRIYKPLWKAKHSNLTAVNNELCGLDLRFPDALLREPHAALPQNPIILDALKRYEMCGNNLAAVKHLIGIDIVCQDAVERLLQQAKLFVIYNRGEFRFNFKNNDYALEDMLQLKERLQLLFTKHQDLRLKIHSMHRVLRDTLEVLSESGKCAQELLASLSLDKPQFLLDPRFPQWNTPIALQSEGVISLVADGSGVQDAEASVILSLLQDRYKSLSGTPQSLSTSGLLVALMDGLQALFP